MSTKESQPRAPVQESSALELRARPSWFVRYAPVLMVLVGFAIRFAVLWSRQVLPFFDFVHPFTISGETASIAMSVAEGKGFSSPFNSPTGPTAWIGPIYVYLLAAIIKIFGVTQASMTVILTVNSAFSALTAGLIYKLGLKTFDQKTGIVAGWIWALFPTFITVPTRLVWETSLSALLVTLAVLFAIDLSRNGGSMKRWIGLGVFWGITLLANPALATIFPLCLAFIAFRQGSVRRVLQKSVVAVLLCAATTAPWLIRNRMVFGQWVFIRSNFAFEFYLDNHPIPPGVQRGIDHPNATREGLETYKRLGEIGFVQSYGRKAMDYVRSHPAEFLAKSGNRFLSLWTDDVFLYIRRFSQPPLDLQQAALIALFTLFGIVLAALRKPKDWGFLVAIILIYPLPYYITAPMQRYRHPIEPLMVLFIAYLCIEIAGRFRRRTPALG